MSIGWQNPCPFEVGGGATAVERIYDALRANVGVGGSCTNEESIEALWRQARASGLAAVGTTGERAVINAFPGHATDLLEYYEELLATTPDEGASLVERRAEAERRYTERVDATGPAIDADLKRIDERFGIVAVDRLEAAETQHGRAFQDLAATLPFGGGRKSSRFANYSTGFVLYVVFALGEGVPPGLDEQKLLARAKEHLNKVLPAHVTFQISTSFGFTLDLDLLDLTGLDP